MDLRRFRRGISAGRRAMEAKSIPEIREAERSVDGKSRRSAFDSSFRAVGRRLQHRKAFASVEQDYAEESADPRAEGN